MFIQVLESMGKVTGSTVALQQEMFRKWVGMWPALLNSPTSSEQVEGCQKQWSETACELIRRQREIAEAQFKAGMQNIEKAFQVGEARTPEELRARTIELWKKCFDSVFQASEAQVRETQVAVEKWFELMTPAAPSS